MDTRHEVNEMHEGSEMGISAATIAKGRANITETAGGISANGPEAVQVYRALVLLNGLRMECKGLRLTRGRSCYAIAKAEYGLKGNKARVLSQLESILRARGMEIL